MERLLTWPDLTACPADCGTGHALRTTRDEIVHFHSARDVDLHLTRRAIQRFHYDLGGSSAIQVVPDSDWVTVHLDCATEMAHIRTKAAPETAAPEAAEERNDTEVAA